ncbi:hypothetical protein E2P81_ATG07308 [Venturia nashicola]|nr:hypothetical protein E2P81_ATG07308 [Venturia nashicola]
MAFIDNRLTEASFEQQPSTPSSFCDVRRSAKSQSSLTNVSKPLNHASTSRTRCSIFSRLGLLAPDLDFSSQILHRVSASDRVLWFVVFGCAEPAPNHHPNLFIENKTILLTRISPAELRTLVDFDLNNGPRNRSHPSIGPGQVKKLTKASGTGELQALPAEVVVVEVSIDPIESATLATLSIVGKSTKA